MKSRFLLKSALLLVLTAFLIVLVPSASAQVPSLAGKKVLWLGDSITNGGDYVTFTQYYLDRAYPKDKFDIISIGLASETVSGLSEKAHPFPRPCVLERLQRALDKIKPNLVIACYGMNDGIYHPQSPERMQSFQDGMHKLISTCQAAGAQVILLTPPPFDKTVLHNLQPETAADFAWTSPFENYDSVLGDYAKWEQSLPATDAFVIDLHTPIDDYLTSQRQTNPQFSFVQDGIHPNAAGHLLMAETILKALKVPVTFNADLNAELAATAKDPLYAMVKNQRESRSNGWLPYVGYIRGGKTGSDVINPTEQTNTELQTKIDALRNP